MRGLEQVRDWVEGMPLSIIAGRVRLFDDNGQDMEPALQESLQRYVRKSFPGAPLPLQERLVDTMLLRRKGVLHGRLRHGHGINWAQVGSVGGVALPRFVSSMVTLHNSLRPEGPGDGLQKHDQAAQSLPNDSEDASYGWPIPSVATSLYEDLSGFFPAAPIGLIVRKHMQIQQQNEDNGDLESALQQSSKPNDHLAGNIPRMTQQDLTNAAEALGKVVCPFCVEPIPAQSVIDDEKWKFVNPAVPSYPFRKCSRSHI